MNEDGGPAFPCDPDKGHCTGLSLRDYFAGQAISGLVIKVRAQGTDTEELVRVALAAEAYRLADEMLKAREST